MQRVVLVDKATVRWEDAPDPAIDSPASAIVRPLAVATCDLDVGVLHGTFPLPGPYPFGHEAVAEVVSVGEDVATVVPGDVVVVPFQISCGACAQCLRGRTGNCASHPFMSSYGLGTIGGLQWGGLLADLALVPHADAMLVVVPAGIAPVSIASASDNIADAWRTVGPQLAAEPGAPVLVVGGRAGPNSIGLYAVGIAAALGAERVVYADVDSDRNAIAAGYGAEVLDGPWPRKAGVFPITVDASGDPDGLACALNSTASDGVCTSPSIYLSDPSIPMFGMYSRCCTLQTGRAHVRPAISAVLDLVASGFDASHVTSEVVTKSAAVEALTEAPMKLVIDYTAD